MRQIGCVCLTEWSYNKVIAHFIIPKTMNIAFYGQNKTIREPNICPHCHIVQAPRIAWQQQSTDSDSVRNLLTAWQCSNDSCSRIFVAVYKIDGQELKFNRFLNGLPKGPDWPKPVSDLKNGNSADTANPEQSKFIKTYLQSLAAENNGLDELAGMGFRKAIEYLVKDWAIQMKPADKDKIEASWLGVVIKDYYNGDLKEILERATWLGNDQAHYNRLFKEFDIDVLKELIELIMVELDRQFKMRHYIDKIQRRQ